MRGPRRRKQRRWRRNRGELEREAATSNREIAAAAAAARARIARIARAARAARHSCRRRRWRYEGVVHLKLSRRGDGRGGRQSRYVS